MNIFTLPQDPIKILANNEAASAALINHWSMSQQYRDSQGRIPQFEDIDGRFVMSKAQARHLFTDAYDYHYLSTDHQRWYSYVNYSKNLLDPTTIYSEEDSSLRIQAALKAGLNQYVKMTGSLKLLTPKDILILMSITPGNKFPRAGYFRQYIGMNLMRPKQAQQYWSNHHD